MSSDKFRKVIAILAAVAVVSGLHYGRHDVGPSNDAQVMYQYDRLTGEVCWLILNNQLETDSKCI